MSEQNNENTPLTIEDHFRAVLSGDRLKNALDYVAYKRAKGVHYPDAPPGSTAWRSDFGVIGTEITDGIPGWWICMGGWDSETDSVDTQNLPIDEKLKEYAWANVRICQNYRTDGQECGCGFQPGRRAKYFGKWFDHTCHGGVEAKNPDGEALELAKRLPEVWAQCVSGTARYYKPYIPKENEWPSATDIGAHMGRPLGKAYTKSLNVQFTVTPRYKLVHASTIAFSGGGWVPATWQQIPAALRIGGSGRFEAAKGPGEDWAAIETLKYQRDVTHFVEMSFNIEANTYSATAYMLDADGEHDTPYQIAKDYPFRLGTGDSAIPRIKAIDTVYVGLSQIDSMIIVKAFKVVGGE